MMEKITDAVLTLLGRGQPLTAYDMAEVINREDAFSGIRAKWRSPIQVDQVYAAMSGLRSKTSVQRTLIQPVHGRLGKGELYQLTGYGEKRLRALQAGPAGRARRWRILGRLADIWTTRSR